jgi:hypothetical protein
MQKYQNHVKGIYLRKIQFKNFLHTLSVFHINGINYFLRETCLTSKRFINCLAENEQFLIKESLESFLCLLFGEC